MADVLAMIVLSTSLFNYLSILVIASIVLCVGNFMYFAATSKYMIMGSRFIVGECTSQPICQ